MTHGWRILWRDVLLVTMCAYFVHAASETFSVARAACVAVEEEEGRALFSRSSLTFTFRPRAAGGSRVGAGVVEEGPRDPPSSRRLGCPDRASRRSWTTPPPERRPQRVSGPPGCLEAGPGAPVGTGGEGPIVCCTARLFAKERRAVCGPRRKGRPGLTRARVLRTGFRPVSRAARHECAEAPKGRARPGRARRPRSRAPEKAPAGSAHPRPAVGGVRGGGGSVRGGRAGRGGRCFEGPSSLEKRSPARWQSWVTTAAAGSPAPVRPRWRARRGRGACGGGRGGGAAARKGW